MATFTHQLQGVTPTTMYDTDNLQFAGASGFDSKITVGEYNDSTHVKSSGGANDSDGNTPVNVKYIDTDEADWGDGAESLSDIQNAECTLKITFNHNTEVATENAIFYSYDGSTPATPMVGVNFFAAEKGNTNWTEAEGSGAALGLADQSTPAENHYFYIACSASPTSVGQKTGKYRIELTYF